MEVYITSVFQYLGILPFHTHGRQHLMALYGWVWLSGSGKWAARGSEGWMTFSCWVSANLGKLFSGWRVPPVMQPLHFMKRKWLSWCIFCITSDLLVKKKWLSVLSHEMLGCLLPKQSIAHPILSNILTNGTQVHLERGPLMCRQLIFQHKVKLQSSRERMVLVPQDIHLRGKE